MSMVIIERGRVSLTRAAVVNNDELPATTRDRSAINLRANGARQITITRTATASSAAATKQSLPKSARLFVSVFFDC